MKLIIHGRYCDTKLSGVTYNGFGDGECESFNNENHMFYTIKNKLCCVCGNDNYCIDRSFKQFEAYNAYENLSFSYCDKLNEDV